MSDTEIDSSATLIQLPVTTTRQYRAMSAYADAARDTMASVLALNAVLLKRIVALQQALDGQRVHREAVVVRPAFGQGADRSTVARVAPCIAGLTPKQRQVLTRVLAGHANKIIAADLGISQRTVENHRAAIMKRSGATSLPALARMAVGRPEVGDSH